MTSGKNEQLKGLLTKLRSEAPLIHNITNLVVTNFTANGLLALGASPVMAYAKEEVADMAMIAKALVLNIGTLTADNVESMIIAGKAANKAKTPVILDPVGAGATFYRTESVHRILKEVKVSLVRGNAAEIANIAGLQGEIKGVDAVHAEDNEEIAKHAATTLQVPVVITGETDFVTDGKSMYLVKNGHAILTKVTGTGCLLSSVIAAFIAIEENILLASTAALAVYGVAAELAWEKTEEYGPGSFQIEFLNQLAKITEADVLSLAQVLEGEF